MAIRSQLAVDIRPKSYGGIPISGGCTVHTVLRPVGIRPIAVGIRRITRPARIIYDFYYIALNYIIFYFSALPSLPSLPYYIRERYNILYCVILYDNMLYYITLYDII